MVKILLKKYKGGTVEIGKGFDRGSVLIVGKRKVLHQYSNKTAKKLGLIKATKKRR